MTQMGIEPTGAAEPDLGHYTEHREVSPLEKPSDVYQEVGVAELPNADATAHTVNITPTAVAADAHVVSARTPQKSAPSTSELPFFSAGSRSSMQISDTDTPNAPGDGGLVLLLLPTPMQSSQSF